jgi:hypothetical protein
MGDHAASGPRHRLVALAVAVAVGALLGAAVVVAVRGGGTGPSRQEVVAARGAEVMPFDLDATTHHFETTADGGIQSVVADDPGDGEQVAAIQAHLRAEADRFRAGDFGDPAHIHGDAMPGLDVLAARADDVDVAYRDLAGGAQLTYRSDDPRVVAALQDWFGAQVADHGDHASADAPR